MMIVRSSAAVMVILGRSGVPVRCATAELRDGVVTMVVAAVAAHVMRRRHQQHRLHVQ